MKSGLTVREAAELLGVGKTTLYEHFDRDASLIDVGWTQLRILTIGRRVIVPRAEVDRALCMREAS